MGRDRALGRGAPARDRSIDRAARRSGVDGYSSVTRLRVALRRCHSVPDGSAHCSVAAHRRAIDRSRGATLALRRGNRSSLFRPPYFLTRHTSLSSLRCLRRELGETLARAHHSLVRLFEVVPFSRGRRGTRGSGLSSPLGRRNRHAHPSLVRRVLKVRHTAERWQCVTVWRITECFG